MEGQGGKQIAGLVEAWLWCLAMGSRDSAERSWEGPGLGQGRGGVARRPGSALSRLEAGEQAGTPVQRRFCEGSAFLETELGVWALPPSLAKSEN